MLQGFCFGFVAKCWTSQLLLKRTVTRLVTCPIFYANSVPHLGHAYTLCLGDAWARYLEIRKKPYLKAFNYDQHDAIVDLLADKKRTTLLTSGCDEHGTKIFEAARSYGMDPRQFCNEIAPHFQKLCKSNSIEIGDFIRTTETRHLKSVEAFWKRLTDSGSLYWGNYSGWYSIRNEQFYGDHEISRSSKVNVNSNDAPQEETCFVADTGIPVTWYSEENLIFRLTDFKADLHNWLDSGVFSKQSENQLAWCKLAHDMVDQIDDISVSRPKDRLSWGIPVPGYADKQVIYVWVDALVNYLTVSGFPWTDEKSTLTNKLWPAEVQIFGQDILKFHAVIWPALLMAANLPLPRKLICHHHLLVNGVKMSKSLGNVVDPFTEEAALVLHKARPKKVDIQGETKKFKVSDSNIFDNEGLRYGLLRLAVLSSDSVYSRDAVIQQLNTELANWIGNLLSRVTANRLNVTQTAIELTHEEALEIFNDNEDDIKLINDLQKFSDDFDFLWYHAVSPNQAVDHLLKLVRETNMFVSRHAPWHIPINQSATSEIGYREAVLGIAMETLRIAGILLWPIRPMMSTRLLERLGYSTSGHLRPTKKQVPYKQPTSKHRLLNYDEDWGSNLVEKL